MGLRAIGKEVQEFVAKHGGAAGLKNDDGNAGSDLGFEDVECAKEQFLRPVQHAKIIQRSSATDVLSRHPYTVSDVFEDFDGCGRRFRMEIVIEGIRPEDDRSSLDSLAERNGPSLEPLAEALASKRRDIPARRNSRYKFCRMAQPPALREPIDQRSEPRSRRGPAVDMGNGVVVERTKPPFIVMGEELSFISRHINGHGTIFLAPLA